MPRTAHRRTAAPSSRQIAAVAISLAALTSGCREPAVDRIELPIDRVFADAAVVVAPDRHWESVPKHKDRWQFKGIAALHCYVSERPSTLGIVLAADELTATYRFAVEWDGRELYPEPIAVETTGTRIEIPADALGRGIHTLSLTRRYRPPQLRDAEARHENVFARLEVELDGATMPLSPRRLDTLRHLDDLLAFGLAGSSKQKRSGFVFAGPRSETLEVFLTSPGRFRTHGDNLSSTPVKLTVAAGDERREATLEPGSGRDFDVPLPAGSSTLVLTAEADDAGEALVLWGAPAVVRDRAPERTPVVLITLDTTRRDALGLYGDLGAPTPHLDALGRQADVYERAYSTAPWTLPSHMSMMSGLYPSRHGAGVRTQLGRDGVRTLASLLRDAGYRTAGFAGGDLSSYRFGIASGFDLYRDPDRFETRGDVLTDYAISFLDEEGSAPFFLFLNYFDAHGAYQAPEEFRRRLGLDELARKVVGQPLWADLAAGDGGAWRKVARSEATGTPEGLAYLRASYLAEVAYLDSQVGRLFEALKTHGLFDRALIVILGDHGELLGEGDNFGHSGRLDPELTEVPLIVKRPGQTEGRRIGALASGVDVFPTVLHAVGLEIPSGDGLRLDPDVLASARRGQVLFEEHEARVHPLNPRLRLDNHVYGVQKPGFRQVVWPRGQECRRFENGGWREVPCTASHEEVLANVEKFLGGVEARDGTEPGVLSDEVTRSLEALGYL